MDTTERSGRNREISVDSGAGDDLVDASAAGAETSVRLGPGADSFAGSAFDDYVQVGTVGASLDEPGDPGPYDVATGAGKDTLIVDVGAVVTADLGGGADGLLFRSVEGTPASHVDLGPGRDGASFEDDWEQEGAGETTLRVDLTRDLMEWHGVTSVLLGAENIRGVARRIRVRGDEGPNSFSSFGCDVTFRGGAGDDTALMRTIGIGGHAAVHLQARGGPAGLRQRGRRLPRAAGAATTSSSVAQGGTRPTADPPATTSASPRSSRARGASTRHALGCDSMNEHAA